MIVEGWALLTFTGRKVVSEGPAAFIDAARFLQQPRAPTMPCTSSVLGLPGTAGGAPLSSLPTWGILTAEDHAQQVPPVCSRGPLGSAFLSFPGAEAERAALSVLLLPRLAA